LRDVWAAGMFPFAMAYRDETGVIDKEWARFQREWVRPQIVYSRLKEGCNLAE